MTTQALQTGTIVSLHGRDLGFKADDKGLVSNGYRLNHPGIVCDATISAEGATVSNQRDISIALKDSKGAAVGYATVEIIVFADAAGAAITTTGGSTGIAEAGTPVGKILATLVAKKVFLCRTSSAGLLNLIYTDVGTDVAFLGIRLPNGITHVIGELTCA